MRKFPEPIQVLMTALTRLPGVGPKTALRYVYTLLSLGKADRDYVARAINNLERINICPKCFTHTEHAMCTICQDDKRDDSVICVVSDSRDISTIEATEMYKGRYHVLGGNMNPVEGIGPEHLRVRELVNRIKGTDDVQEIILALAPDIPGEMTMHHITKILKPHTIRTTRLARGLPMGASLEYADEVTLGDALKGRRESN